MKIYTVTTDDNCGTEVRVFTDEAKADEYALNWCRKQWWDDFGAMPKEFSKAMQTLRAHDCGEFIWYEAHEIDDAPIIRSAQAQLGDLLEQVYQMKGLFSDEDGRIQQAIEDAEAWPNAT